LPICAVHLDRRTDRPRDRALRLARRRTGGQQPCAGTFAGYGKIDPAVAWKKLAVLRAGADIADEDPLIPTTRSPARQVGHRTLDIIGASSPTTGRWWRRKSPSRWHPGTEPVVPAGRWSSAATRARAALFRRSGPG
jgi:hypothetical protein